MNEPMIPRTKLTYVLSAVFVLATSYGVHMATRSWLNTELAKTQEQIRGKQSILTELCKDQPGIEMCGQLKQ